MNIVETTTAEWLHWLLIYTSHVGATSRGYLGHLISEHEGTYRLDSAIEFHSQVQLGPNGQAAHQVHGFPIEFSATSEIEVIRPIAVIKLDRLKGEALRPYATAREEAKQILATLKPVRDVYATAPRIVMPPR